MSELSINTIGKIGPGDIFNYPNDKEENEAYYLLCVKLGTMKSPHEYYAVNVQTGQTYCDEAECITVGELLDSVCKSSSFDAKFVGRVCSSEGDWNNQYEW